MTSTLTVNIVERYSVELCAGSYEIQLLLIQRWESLSLKKPYTDSCLK
jgi:hypothetical protein